MKLLRVGCPNRTGTGEGHGHTAPYPCLRLGDLSVPDCAGMGAGRTSVGQTRYVIGQRSHVVKSKHSGKLSSCRGPEWRPESNSVNLVTADCPLSTVGRAGGVAAALERHG